MSCMNISLRKRNTPVEYKFEELQNSVSFIHCCDLIENYPKTKSSNNKV